MKKVKLRLPILAVLLLISLPTFSQSEMNKKSMMQNSQTINLKKGELFLVISSITKQGAEEEMNAYFGKIFPVASKNGFKPLATLPIDDVVAGNYKPNNFVGLYSWPGMDAVTAFSKELPNSELTPMRVKIWDELKQIMSVVSEDFQFTLYNDKVYELQTLWCDDMGMMDKKLKSKVKKNKGKVIFSFPVAGYEDLKQSKAPSHVMLIEWPSKMKANSYRAKNKMSCDGMEEAFLTHLQLPQTMGK